MLGFSQLDLGERRHRPAAAALLAEVEDLQGQATGPRVPAEATDM